MIPVTVIGGYLGAGKTTLINHLLRTARGVRLAVLVNDFGELAIDADLIEARDDDVIAIAGGCVCCSFGSDLMAGLERLAARTPAPDHVLVETSGVALPGVVARSVALVPGFGRDGVVVLADADTVMARAADRYMGDTIGRQLAEADLLILNKIDLPASDHLIALRGWLATMVPQARLIDAVRGEVPLEVVLGSGPGVADGTERELDPPDDANLCYEARSFAIPPGTDARALAHALARPETGVIRAKGIVSDRDGSRKWVQIVGARVEIADVDTPGRSQDVIVCIGARGILAPVAIEDAIHAETARSGVIRSARAPSRDTPLPTST
jgi:G3E family GTPase